MRSTSATGTLRAVLGDSLRRYLGVGLLTFAVLTTGAAALWAAGPRVSAILDDDVYHLLVLGSDADPVHGAGSGSRGTNALAGRADSVQLISVSADRQHASIVSFPRDLWTGSARINEGLMGGPERMVGVVEGVTGVDIDDWAVSSFSGVVGAIDAVGGVRIDVEQRLLNSNASTDLQPGVQKLTGWSALGYTRDRKSRSDGDFGRSTAQANVLRAMHEQYIAGEGPMALADGLAVLQNHVATSIPAHKLIVLASIASQLDPANVTHVQIRGSLGFAGAASVVRLNNEASAVFAELQANGVITP